MPRQATGHSQRPKEELLVKILVKMGCPEALQAIKEELAGTFQALAASDRDSALML